MLNLRKRLFASSVERHFITEKLESGVVLFKMNRPDKRNAISKLLLNQFIEAIDEHQNAKAIILSSVSKGTFCAGADLKERATMKEEDVPAFVKKLRMTFTNFE
jgi:methylglutaconyl-CoA hydratase